MAKETPCHSYRNLLGRFQEAEVWLLGFGNAWPFKEAPRFDGIATPPVELISTMPTDVLRFHSRDLLAEEIFGSSRCKAMIGIHPSWREHVTGRTGRPWGIRDWQGQRGRHAGYAGYTRNWCTQKKTCYFLGLSSRPTHEIHLAVWRVHIPSV